MPLTSPRLWIVATPIGNPGDLSPRAREILAKADLILAEDTRRAGQLLGDAGISCRKMVSFFEHNEQKRQPEVLAALSAGQDVALITDAGTPLLSDPGFRLVRACREAGLPVSPVPGPCAAIAAISAAGLAPVPFTFLGFLPRGDKARKDIFAKFAPCGSTLVFFERRDRLQDSLEEALQVLGNRPCVICREITKIYEDFRLGTLADAKNICKDLLGEITVVIGPAEEAEITELATVLELLNDARDRGLKPKEAAREVREQIKGYGVRELYELLVNQEKQ